MPATFRGDPYRVLGLDRRASDAAIKRRWRELAREHHPDRATSAEDTARLTRRMARINAAYDLLRDPAKRAAHDAQWAGEPSPVAPEDERWHAPEESGAAAAGPPPPPRARPVTARFDMSPAYRRRNATMSAGRIPLAGQRPIASRERRVEQEPERASDPTGPVRRRTRARRVHLPDLRQARATVLEFGKFRGHTLGEVEAFEPTYIDWLARTITRDRDIVVGARVIQADMDARGVERRYREPTPPFGAGRRAAG